MARGNPPQGAGSSTNQKMGKATFSGTGAQTAFNIAHGLGVIPTIALVEPNTTAASGAHFTTVDATNITITFTVAPANGSSNVIFYWLVQK